jgi:hypothetical protein
MFLNIKPVADAGEDRVSRFTRVALCLGLSGT